MIDLTFLISQSVCVAQRSREYPPVGIMPRLLKHWLQKMWPWSAALHTSVIHHVLELQLGFYIGQERLNKLKGHFGLVYYSSCVRTLIVVVLYINWKSHYSPLQPSITCKGHVSVEWATELNVWLVPHQKQYHPIGSHVFFDFQKIPVTDVWAAPELGPNNTLNHHRVPPECGTRQARPQPREMLVSAWFCC